MGLKVQPPSLVVSPERIAAMDEQGIDIEALSINPIFRYKAERELAVQVVKLQNEKLAEICARRSRTGLSVWRRSPRSIRISPPSSSKMRSSGFDCADVLIGGRSRIWNCPIPNFIPSGPGRSSWVR
jgi:hypothetical protein